MGVGTPSDILGAVKRGVDMFDMCLMSKCKYHIIANSSFSWWGAWLADSEKIIAPKNWFAGDCAHKDTKDMAFGEWTWL